MKGLSLEQVDRTLAETSPRKSAGWVPRATFAQEMDVGKVWIEFVHVEHNEDRVEIASFIGAPWIKLEN